jgi:hypothetical protein
MSIEFQAPICPKCFDDHTGDKCTPRDDSEFMPSVADGSTIAENYRRVIAERNALRNENLELKIALKTCKHDFWFMSTILDGTSRIDNLKDVVKDCIHRMNFRRPMFQKFLPERNNPNVTTK